jgi:hypothetical protein
MRKLLFVLFASTASFTSFSQSGTPAKKTSLADRAGDHLMIQVSSDRWLGAPDSIDSRRKSLSRAGNIYIMMDKPFKGNPRFSAAFGIGVGTSSILLKNTEADITGSIPTLGFTYTDSANHFKKYKITTSFLEIPVELRYTAHPETPGKTFKMALGLKVGKMLKASAKGKNLLDVSGNTVNEFTQKISSTRYFNTTRLAATARVGYGYFSLFGSYNITSVFKDGVAADMKLLQVGLTISGL